MHGRRRATSAATAALLPRLPISHRSVRQDNRDNTNSTNPISLAFLSSPSSLSSISSSNSDVDNILTSTSSNSSRSSSSRHSVLTSDTFRSTSPVLTRQNTVALRKSRGRTRHSTAIPIQAANIAGSSRRRLIGGASRLRSADQPVSTEPTTRPSLSGLVRCPVPVSSKPVSTRSRRRITQPGSSDLVSSPLNLPPPLNDSVQIVAMESQALGSSNSSTRMRLGRTATQPARTNRPGSLTRRTLIGSRVDPLPLQSSQAVATGPHRRTPNFSSLPSVRRTRSAADTADLQAALVAARRRPGSPTEDDDCVICLCEKSNRSVVLPCMHTFCFDCIHRWLTINPSCPLCKRLAQRVIHSVLSDTEFTELLVSDLQDQHNLRRGVTGLPASFDLEEQLLIEQDNEVQQEQQHHRRHQQSHHHYHYHLGSPPVRFLDYLNGMAQGNSSATSLFFQPIVIPPVNPLSQTALDAGQPRPTFRWNSEFGPLVESHRSLLTTLVNNALRRRNSSLLDGLLLRQLVYVFGFDSLPVAQEPELERDITPNFLATNETQRQRLQTFVRRDLRVLAPWLAYRSSELNSTGSNATSNNILADEPQAGSAITAPLICGAPGLLADTNELDLITERVVHQFTMVPMTDENSLIQLLTSFPALQQPLVPPNYLSHFCSEVIQFARYSGTLEQYDYAACLYRRRLSSTGTHRTGEAGGFRPPRTTRPDPRLAVYMASACWPRLRPGFTEPQGLITHPLINWLLQRLFVHSVSGSIHPVRLPGTGEYPTTIPPEPLVFQSSRIVCHPHCSRLARLSRALLEALPTTIRLRSATTTAVGSPGSVSDLGGRDGSISGNFVAGGTARGMTSVELFPNRLVYQRILSELIDQARFSEALSGYFNRYRMDVANSPSDPVATAESSSSSGEVFPRPSSGRDFLLNFIDGWISERSTESTRLNDPLNLSCADRLQSALEVHGRALRRLSGLLLLFTARVPSGLRSEHDEDVISELLHTPLMPMTLTNSATPAPLIDLTTNSSGRNTGISRSDSTHNPSSRTSSSAALPVLEENDPVPLSGSDWHFLLRPAPVSWSAVDSQRPPAAENNWLPSSCQANQNEVTGNAEQEAERPQQEEVQAIWSSPSPPVADSMPSVDRYDASPYHIATSPAQTDSGWRMSTNPCVIISSDSSSDSSEEGDGAEVEVRTVRPQSPYATTADESDDEVPVPIVSKNANKSAVITETATPYPPLDHSDILNVEDNTSKLSLGPQLSDTATSSTSLPIEIQPVEELSRTEEPMDVDEKLDDVDVEGAPLSVPQQAIALTDSGSKRPLPTNSKDYSDTVNVMPSSSKCARKNDPTLVYYPLRPKLALYRTHVKSSPMNVHWVAPYGFTSSRLTPHHHRHRHHRRTRSRSPIVLESSESDCELLRESIHVYSDSSSCSSSSTSSSSSSTACSRSNSRSKSVSVTSEERNRSPHDPSSPAFAGRSKRAVDGQTRHHRCHRHHHHRHHYHGCRKHRKCGHRSKRHRHSNHHRSCHRKRCSSPPPRHYHSLRLFRRSQKTVQLNSTSSPILISDEESDQNYNMPNLTRETESHEPPAFDPPEPAVIQNSVLSPTPVNGQSVANPTDPDNPLDSMHTSEPCCSHSGTGVAESSMNETAVNEVVVNTADQEREQISDKGKQRIFEPSNADDFYHFLARLEANQHSDPSYHHSGNTPQSSHL